MPLGSGTRVNHRDKKSSHSCAASLGAWVAALTVLFLTLLRTSNHFGVHPTKTGYAFTSRGATYILPGAEWRDTDGELIQAHGGGVLHHGGVFYWYGENKTGPTFRPEITLSGSADDSNHDGTKPSFKLGFERVNVSGVSCYTSRDLVVWHSAGLALQGGQHEDLAPEGVVERPKVLFHEPSRRFVMWLHINNQAYSKARVGVAVSNRPQGPFTYLRSFRPHGEESRDFTVFKDADGAAYIAYASEGNKVMHISRLTADYLDVDAPFIRTMVGLHREAPAVFKHQEVYFMLTSGLSGWEPNAAEVFTADDPLGKWRSLGSPCAGASALARNYTFFSQGSFVLPLPGRLGHFVFMADQWNPTNLSESRYLWLPLWVNDVVSQQGAAGQVTVQWLDRWQPHQPKSWTLQHEGGSASLQTGPIRMPPAESQRQWDRKP